MSHFTTSPNGQIATFATRAFFSLSVITYCFLAIFGGGGEINAAAATHHAARQLTILPSPNEGQNTATADTTVALITAARTGAQIRSPHNDPAGMIILTLEANNIQVQTKWRVTSVADSFAITNGTLSLTPKAINQAQILVATVYAVDQFDQLNPAYDNLTAIALITVEIRANISLSLATVPALMIFAGDTSPLHTLVATGGGNNKTYTIVAGNTNGYFTLGHDGILAAKAQITTGNYLLSIDVRDQYNNRAGLWVTVAVAMPSMLSGAGAVRTGTQTQFTIPASEWDAAYESLIAAGEYYVKYDGRYFRITDTNGPTITIDAPVRQFSNAIFEVFTVVARKYIEDANEIPLISYYAVLQGRDYLGPRYLLLPWDTTANGDEKWFERTDTGVIRKGIASAGPFSIASDAGGGLGRGFKVDNPHFDDQQILGYLVSDAEPQRVSVTGFDFTVSQAFHCYSSGQCSTDNGNPTTHFKVYGSVWMTVANQIANDFYIKYRGKYFKPAGNWAIDNGQGREFYINGHILRDGEDTPEMVTAIDSNLVAAVRKLHYEYYEYIENTSGAIRPGYFVNYSETVGIGTDGTTLRSTGTFESLANEKKFTLMKTTLLPNKYAQYSGGGIWVTHNYFQLSDGEYWFIISRL